MAGPTNTPIRDTNRGKETRLAVLLSAAVYPGVGQFAQKRFLAGILYAALFSAALLLLLWSLFAPLIANLRIVMDFADHGGNEPLRCFPVGRFLFFLCLTVILYLLGLIDTIRSARRPAGIEQHGCI